MVFLTLYMAYWRWELPDGRRRSMWTDTEHVTVRIYRLTQVPTPEMIANNETQWSPGWNLTSPRGSQNNAFYLVDNDLPINFATLTLSFFAISAIAHLWACLVGIFESWWFLYWRQMDDAFCYWRWIEYSASASVMAMAIAISVGLREQSILASIFMLHFTTMCFGFLTEYISVPKSYVDDNVYKYPIGRDEFAMWRRGQTDYGKVRYETNNRALKLISQSEWEKDRPLYHIQDPKNIDLTSAARADMFVSAQRTDNYMRRMASAAYRTTYVSCTT